MQNFTELYEVERRYEELAHKMSTPDAAANADEYARMMRDYKELTPLIEEYRRYTDLQQQEADAKEMLAAESDPAAGIPITCPFCRKTDLWLPPKSRTASWLLPTCTWAATIWSSVPPGWCCPLTETASCMLPESIRN